MVGGGSSGKLDPANLETTARCSKGTRDIHGRAQHQRGSAMKRDLYAEVSARIVTELEQRRRGLIPRPIPNKLALPGAMRRWHANAMDDDDTFKKLVLANTREWNGFWFWREPPVRGVQTPRAVCCSFSPARRLSRAKKAGNGARLNRWAGRFRSRTRRGREDRKSFVPGPFAFQPSSAEFRRRTNDQSSAVFFGDDD